MITTKVEVRAENLDDIAGHIERSVDASLKRLQVDSVDVIQIHNGPVAQRPNLQGRAYNILALEDYLNPAAPSRAWTASSKRARRATSASSAAATTARRSGSLSTPAVSS